MRMIFEISKSYVICINQVGNKDLELPVRKPDMDKLKQLAYSFHVNLGMSLVGIDVIIENHTGRYAVIDINTFPGKQS